MKSAVYDCKNTERNANNFGRKAVGRTLKANGETKIMYRRSQSLHKQENSPL